jgi:hypothetical protein
MWTLASKIVALLIAIGYVVAAIVQEHELNRVAMGVSLLTSLPLALIWFPEELGSFTGSVGRGGSIDAETPPALVSFMGWLLLVGLPVSLYLCCGPHS